MKKCVLHKLGNKIQLGVWWGTVSPLVGSVGNQGHKPLENLYTIFSLKLKTKIKLRLFLFLPRSRMKQRYNVNDALFMLSSV